MTRQTYDFDVVTGPAEIRPAPKPDPKPRPPAAPVSRDERGK